MISTSIQSLICGYCGEPLLTLCENQSGNHVDCMNRFNSTTPENCGHQKDMTIEETKEAIKVMQAFVDGKKILFCSNPEFSNVWQDLPNSPIWDWRHSRYEIKPEPKEFWIVDGAAYKSQSEAIHFALSFKPAVKLIHVREVV